MPHHVISTRPLLPEEEHQLGVPRDASVEKWGCTVAVLAVAALIGCGAGAILQLSFRAVTQPGSLPFLGGLLAVGFASMVARSVYLNARESRARAAATPDIATADVIEVLEPVAVQQLASDDEGPFYYLDIGGGSLLVLSGPRLLDVPAYQHGRPWPADDRGGDADWQPPFLTSHFVLHRAPHSGRVLKIDVVGDPIPVSRILPIGTVPTDRRESRVIEGSLDEVAAAMARALDRD
jgi:hypothetical protein